MPENDDNDFFRSLRVPLINEDGEEEPEDDPNEEVARSQFEHRLNRLKKQMRFGRHQRLNPVRTLQCEVCGHDLKMEDEKFVCSNGRCETRKAKSRYQILLEREEDPDGV